MLDEVDEQKDRMSLAAIYQVLQNYVLLTVAENDSANIKGIEEFKMQMMKEFKISDIGLLSYYIGIGGLEERNHRGEVGGLCNEDVEIIHNGGLQPDQENVVLKTRTTSMFKTFKVDHGNILKGWKAIAKCIIKKCIFTAKKGPKPRPRPEPRPQLQPRTRPPAPPSRPRLPPPSPPSPPPPQMELYQPPSPTTPRRMELYRPPFPTTPPQMELYGPPFPTTPPQMELYRPPFPTTPPQMELYQPPPPQMVLSKTS
ncbi:formin-A-like [Impatiens glandulifera]|uniref:formin-A-like n=1 Tax=Impatiens glandulifera TaxID=253017 RepID=UPI001FB061E9|nr:formin-A-like [Impatiens glandulifera]